MFCHGWHQFNSLINKNVNYTVWESLKLSKRFLNYHYYRAVIINTTATITVQLRFITFCKFTSSFETICTWMRLVSRTDVSDWKSGVGRQKTIDVYSVWRTHSTCIIIYNDVCGGDGDDNNTFLNWPLLSGIGPCTKTFLESFTFPFTYHPYVVCYKWLGPRTSSSDGEENTQKG